jgi:hypothetical protein
VYGYQDFYMSLSAGQSRVCGPTIPVGPYLYSSPRLADRPHLTAMRYVGIIECPAGRACYENSPAD